MQVVLSLKKKARVFTVAERLKLTLMGALNRVSKVHRAANKTARVNVYRQRLAPSSGLNEYELLRRGHRSSHLPTPSVFRFKK